MGSGMEILDMRKARRLGRPTIDLESVRAAYRRYVGVYDFVFGATLEPGRKAAVQAINMRPDRRILEVGVGTGLSLPDYRRDCHVTGIDLSSDMLEKARRRVARLALRQIEGLAVMDGQDMAFADHSFDTVVAMYVLSVVPSPERLLAEMKRVCVPGGEIAIVNHFASTHRLARSLESSLAGFATILGFRPNQEREALAAYEDLTMIESRRINLFGSSSLVRFRNQPKAA
jgi:phosphatidylethanolamine/phosphatidyl-N-methylethanolamine N-methyltransferase